MLKKKKQKQEKSESQLCYALAQDQVRNLLDCLVFSSHMFLIDTPEYQPCPFLQLIQISVIKWTILHVIMLAVGVSVSLNTVDVVCILVAFKEFGFCFVDYEVLANLAAFSAKSEVLLIDGTCCQEHVGQPYFHATKEVYLTVEVDFYS